jgi:uncharacterized protein YjiS (DUF1127 family)
MTLVTSITKLLIGLWARLAGLAEGWHSRQRASLYLEAWPDSMLKDIGIARSEIHHVTRFGRSPNSSERDGCGHAPS